MTSQNKRSRSIVRDKPSLFTILSHSLTKNSIRLFCCYYQQHNKINQINFIFYFYVFYPDYHRLTPFNIVFCFHHDHLHPSTSSFTLMGFLFFFFYFCWAEREMRMKVTDWWHRSALWKIRRENLNRCGWITSAAQRFSSSTFFIWTEGIASPVSVPFD